MASTDFIIDRHTYSIRLRALIDSGSRLYFDISDSGSPLFASGDDDINQMLNANYVHIVVKNPLFASDNPRVKFINGVDGSWHIFSPIAGDGHILLTAKNFSLAAKYYRISVGYNSYFVADDGRSARPPMH